MRDTIFFELELGVKFFSLLGKYSSIFSLSRQDLGRRAVISGRGKVYTYMERLLSALLNPWSLCVVLQNP